MKLPRWTPYLVLGPITGPLALRLYRNLEGGRPVLAGLYALAILETMILLPLVLIELLRAVAG
jgi:hypothetical protein